MRATLEVVKESPHAVWSASYTAMKGDVALAVYRKRADEPNAGEPARPVLLLVHGSSVSALPTYDLNAPGAGEYSVMNVFAGYGYDVWTFDCENYGRSARTSGTSDIASGAADILATLDLIQRETGVSRAHLFGESSGALRIALFAVRHPERVDRLVLSAYTYTGKDSPTLAKRALDVERFKAHPRRLRDQAMINSIFERDRPGTSVPGIGAVIGAVELAFGDQVPTGTYLDMIEHLPIVDPHHIHAPVMMMTGEFDGISTLPDLLDFYAHLASHEKQFIILPATAHSVVWAKNRHLFWHAMHSFLATPAHDNERTPP
jgi:pimeloyl-ACP methyl ester carboxylesterase